MTAKVYAAPIEWVHDYTTRDYKAEMARETAYMRELAIMARARFLRPNHAIGRIIRFGVGDGYAQYMVWTMSPLQLVHLETGDAWNADPILLRGLNAADVRRMTGGKALFGEDTYLEGIDDAKPVPA